MHFSRTVFIHKLRSPYLNWSTAYMYMLHGYIFHRIFYRKLSISQDGNQSWLYNTLIAEQEFTHRQCIGRVMKQIGELETLTELHINMQSNPVCTIAVSFKCTIDQFQSVLFTMLELSPQLLIVDVLHTDKQV